MIHWSKYKNQIKLFVLKTGKLHCISLICFYSTVFLFQNSQIVFHKLYCCHIVSFFIKLNTISSGSRTHIQDFCRLIHRQIFMNIFHRSNKLHLPMSACQTFFFVKLIVIFFKFCHHRCSIPQPLLSFFYKQNPR